MRRRPLAIVGLALLPASLVASGAVAQVGGGYDLSWFSLPGGGGTSQGGQYALTGAIGQPFASTLTGGTYTVQSGFVGGGSSRSYRLVLPYVASNPN